MTDQAKTRTTTNTTKNSEGRAQPKKEEHKSKTRGWWIALKRIPTPAKCGKRQVCGFPFALRINSPSHPSFPSETALMSPGIFYPRTSQENIPPTHWRVPKSGIRMWPDTKGSAIASPKLGTVLNHIFSSGLELAVFRADAHTRARETCKPSPQTSDALNQVPRATACVFVEGTPFRGCTGASIGVL